MSAAAARAEDGVEIDFKIVPVGSGFFVNGEASALSAARCGQCGSPFSSEVSSPFESWCGSVPRACVLVCYR